MISLKGRNKQERMDAEVAKGVTEVKKDLKECGMEDACSATQERSDVKNG